MPIIFNEKEKETLKESLFETGYKRIKQYGYKKTLVEEIARDAGIAKGTFYSFFDSKEQFFYQMIIFNRNKNRKKAEGFFKTEKPNRENTAIFFRDKYLHNNISTAYITSEDLAAIFRKLPDELEKTKLESIEFAEVLLACIPDKSPYTERDVVINMMNIIADYAANREKYFEQVFEHTIIALTKAMTDYIFDCPQQQ